ncbi:hypothetical protein [Neobacillus notoginsengisoli]|uniref:hypothetical protein n=1 Tax=Neobacillus notoginsengisoli TaxID=1578198 RepID=UPI00131466F0|nr:hypothetical protein [Neobacillus notoginsengisoli]
MEVIINDYEFTSRTQGTEIFLYGYEKGNKSNRIYAMVNFAEKKYEVSLIGYDER